MGNRNYTVQTKINCDVSKVFDAIIQPESLCTFFTDKTSGPLIEGEEIIWHWSQWGDYPVVVKKIVDNELIHLRLNSERWKKTEGASYDVDVILEFEALNDNATMLSISEQGWRIDPDGLKGSHENCSGWTHMAMCLKAFLEHGLNLR